MRQEPLSKTLLNEARVFKSQGLLAKAAEYCQQSLDLSQKVSGADAPEAIQQYITLAGLGIARAKSLDKDNPARKRLFSDAEVNSRRRGNCARATVWTRNQSQVRRCIKTRESNISWVKQASPKKIGKWP